MTYSAQLTEKRASMIERAETIVREAQEMVRELTPEEDKAVADALEEVKELDEQIRRHVELEQRATQALEARKENNVEQAVTTIKSEPRTYAPQSDNSFLRDAYAAQFNNDFAASERLSRHMNEEKIERRDVTSAAFAGLIVPQFLTDLAAPFARAGRPFLDAARKHQLPAEGLTISISKVTTGSATAVQTEGAAVQETNMDDTKLDVSVVTVAGQQNVSRQAIERGTNIDSLVMADLVSAYHTNLDSLNVTTSATSLTNVITQVVTYTDASPTVAELYPKIVDANAAHPNQLLCWSELHPDAPTPLGVHLGCCRWSEPTTRSTSTELQRSTCVCIGQRCACLRQLGLHDAWFANHHRRERHHRQRCRHERRRDHHWQHPRSPLVRARQWRTNDVALRTAKGCRT
jgi:HK97 family phage major capsid protein